MPAYHCYLESNITNNTPLLRIVHYLVDGRPIVPAFVALVFPLPFSAHIALLLAAHAHLVLSQWFDCVTLVAYPTTGAAYRNGPLDIVTNPDDATDAVQLCRRVNIVGQAVMLLASGIYSWCVLTAIRGLVVHTWNQIHTSVMVHRRQEHAHRWRFLKAAYEYNVIHGGDAQRVLTTRLKLFGPPCGWGWLALLEVLVLCPLCWASLYRMRSEHQLAVRAVVCG